MKRFVSFGYYNGVDAIAMKDSSANTIIENINNGIGNFHRYDDTDIFNESKEYLLNNYPCDLTNDGNYIVVYDVADRFNDIPINSIDDEIAKDEFVEIWKKNGLNNK